MKKHESSQRKQRDAAHKWKEKDEEKRAERREGRGREEERTLRETLDVV